MTSHRRLVLVAAVLLVLLAGGYLYFWHYMARLLEQGIADWAANERAAGREIAFNEAPITGFPFAFRHEFQRLVMKTPMANGVWSVATASATATMRPWQWQVIDIDATAPVTLAFSASGQPPLALDIAKAQGQVRLMRDGRMERLAIAAEDISLVNEGGNYRAAQGHVLAEFPPLNARSHTDPLLGLELDLTQLILPEGMRALTAEPIASLGLSATILGPVQLDQSPRQAIAEWASNGGTVELKRFGFVQAPLDLAGEGTLALDRDLQLLGALTLRAVGLPETIDLLAADGLVAGNTAKTGRMMAEGLAKPDAKGRRVANIALSLQQGFVWLGPIRLAPLPVLTWE